jgi:L-2-hydroxycarboxylate dehydrogenase (NAD+)
LKDRKTINVPAEALRDFMERMLRAVGCKEHAAALIADVFLEADMVGVGLQGLDHIHTLIHNIRSGYVDPSATPEILKQGEAFATIDGRRGPGQVAAMLAVELATDKARRAGVCCVGITNSSDIFMLGYYAERIARTGLVGLVFTGSPPQVHPWGGIERVLGTNPLAIAFPTAGESPFVVDMATSALSGSRVRQAAYFGETLPDNQGLDANGEPTNIATEIRNGGAIGPLGGHKGFALGLAVALLSGPLVGAQTGRALRGWFSDEKQLVGTRGHLILAIDPSCFGDPQACRVATSDYLEEVKESRRAVGATEIRIPGAQRKIARLRFVVDGVCIYEVVWNKAMILAAELGVTPPSL